MAAFGNPNGEKSAKYKAFFQKEVSEVEIKEEVQIEQPRTPIDLSQVHS